MDVRPSCELLSKLDPSSKRSRPSYLRRSLCILERKTGPRLTLVLEVHGMKLETYPINTEKGGGAELKLDQNDTKDVLPERFKNTHRLRNLRLDGNQLDSIPTKALEPLIYLEALCRHSITSVPESFMTYRVTNVTLNRYLDGPSIKDYFWRLVQSFYNNLTESNNVLVQRGGESKHLLEGSRTVYNDPHFSTAGVPSTHSLLHRVHRKRHRVELGPSISLRSQIQIGVSACVVDGTVYRLKGGNDPGILCGQPIVTPEDALDENMLEENMLCKPLNRFNKEECDGVEILSELEKDQTYEVFDAIEAFTGVTTVTSEQRVDLRTSRHSQDLADTQKIIEWLLLKRNQIYEIDDDAFSNLTSLRELSLNDNRLSTLPKAIGKLTSLQELLHNSTTPFSDCRMFLWYPHNVTWHRHRSDA
uniref:Uncharacterized protein n=1 Tax=Timema bartmani TaxID=61472 RepID=A0A7R9HYX9_9NEOP|nr:unnamed protein product [Timema bartmani]